MPLAASYLAMLHRNTRRYHVIMDEIIKALGGKCADCGGKLDLQIDHVDGRDWEPRKLSALQRANRYMKEMRSGVRLRILCKECNGADGWLRRGTRSGGVDAAPHTMAGSQEETEVA